MLGEMVPQAHEFKYLGSTVGSVVQKEKCKEDTSRLGQWRKVTLTLCDEKIPAKVKEIVFKTDITPTTLGRDCCPYERIDKMASSR